jgi:hypothetical protein
LELGIMERKESKMLSKHFCGAGRASKRGGVWSDGEKEEG